MHFNVTVKFKFLKTMSINNGTIASVKIARKRLLTFRKESSIARVQKYIKFTR